MLNFFSIDSDTLDSKIGTLENKIERAQPGIGRALQHEWDEIFELCAEIAANFKNVRYPNRADRDIAWKRFFDLRDKAFKIKNTQTSQHSEIYFNQLMGELSASDYDAFADFFVGHLLTLGGMKATVEDLKHLGRKLKQAMDHFSSLKLELTSEHKKVIYDRIGEVKRHHDAFWYNYKKYLEGQSQVFEERNRERRRNLERNIDKNKEKLSQSKNFRSYIEAKRDELRDKIYESTSDNWKSKARDWLDEYDDKLSDIDSQVAEIEKWIEEDLEKLANLK